MGEDGRTFLRGIGSETYGLKEFRARQRSTRRKLSYALAADSAAASNSRSSPVDCVEVGPVTAESAIAFLFLL